MILPVSELFPVSLDSAQMLVRGSGNYKMRSFLHT